MRPNGIYILWMRCNISALEHKYTGTQMDKQSKFIDIVFRLGPLIADTPLAVRVSSGEWNIWKYIHAIVGSRYQRHAHIPRCVLIFVHTFRSLHLSTQQTNTVWPSPIDRDKLEFALAMAMALALAPALAGAPNVHTETTPLAPTAQPSPWNNNHPSGHRSVGLIVRLVRRPMTDIAGRSGSQLWHSRREQEGKIPALCCKLIALRENQQEIKQLDVLKTSNRNLHKSSF